VTRKHVGSLFGDQNTICNTYKPKNRKKEMNTDSSDYRKGILLRRSLAQVPPIFKKDKNADESTIMINLDSSVNRIDYASPNLKTMLPDNKQSQKHITLNGKAHDIHFQPKKLKAKVLKIAPKNQQIRFNEADIESGAFSPIKIYDDTCMSPSYLNTNLLGTSRELKKNQDDIRSKIFKRPEGKINKRYARK